MRSEKEVLDILNHNASIQIVRDLALHHSVDVYLFGGALRDYFLGSEPNDLDFLISTNPYEFSQKISSNFPGKILTPPVAKGMPAEISCYLGSNTGDIGKMDFIPLNNFLVQEYLELYQDFTINSIIFDVKKNKISYFCNSKTDIENKIIRSVSSLTSNLSTTNIAPSSIRMLFRAIWLALSLNLTIDVTTHQELKSKTAYYSTHFENNIIYQLGKILNSKDYIKGLNLLLELDFFENIINKLFPFLLTSYKVQESSAFPLMQVIRKCEVIDYLIASLGEHLASFSSNYLFFLRFIALITPNMSQMLLQIPKTQRKKFLIAHGEQIEKNIVDFRSMMRVGAFRIRIVAIASSLAAISLFESNKSLEDVVDDSIKMFGKWKGFFAAILICADWVCSKSSPNSNDIDTARKILESKFSF